MYEWIKKPVPQNKNENDSEICLCIKLEESDFVTETMMENKLNQTNDFVERRTMKALLASPRP